MYDAIKSGRILRSVVFLLSPEHARSDQAYYTVEAATNRGGGPHEISVARGRYVA